MDSSLDYFSMQSNKAADCQDWPSTLPTWEVTPDNDTIDVPMWQYTNLTDTPLQYSYYAVSGAVPSPILSYSHPTSSAPSTMPSPNMGAISFLDEPRSVPRASTSQSPHLEADDELDDEEDSDYAYSPSQRSPKGSSRQSSGGGRKNELANKASVRNAKKAHTVVERNYRERLNDKIADLGLYLFETSSDSRTRPSKSLVMTRAKERLQQLEARNKSLESEVIKLRQHIAILEHVKGDKK